MEKNRYSLLARLHILLKERGVDEETKREMCANYGATTAARLSGCQLEDLIGKLQGNKAQQRLLKDRTSCYEKPEAAPEDIRRLRSEILFFITGDPEAANPRKRGLGIPNSWPVINPFIERHAGKLLFELDTNELEAFKRQLMAMRQSGWRYRKPKQTTPENSPSLILLSPFEMPILLN